MSAEDEVLAALAEKFPEAVSDARMQRERRLWIRVEREKLVEVCRYLRDELDFDHLSSVAGVDYPERLEVVYHLWSYSRHELLALKVALPKEDPRVKTVTHIWGSANWHERETAELFGITFEGHPYPKRLLLADDFEGYPFRKDYKLVAKPWYREETPERRGKA